MLLFHRFKTMNHHQGLMKYLKNILWLFIEKLIRIILGVSITAWVIRYLGPKDFGMLSLAWSIVNLFRIVTTLNLGHIVVKKILEKKIKKDVLIGTSFLLKIIGTNISLLILYIVAPFMTNDPMTHLLIFVLAIHFFFKNLRVVETHFRSKVLLKYVVFSNLISLIICSLIRVYLILNQYPLIYFALTIVFDTILATTFISIFYIRDKQSFLKWRVDFSVGKKLLRECYPLMFSGIVLTVQMKVDQIVLGEMLGVVAVGYYAAASRISESVFYLSNVTSSLLLPAIVNAKLKGKREYAIKTQKVFDFIIFCFLVTSLPIIIFSEKIINFLYGEVFSISSEILSVHIFCGFFVAINHIREKWIINENLQHYSFFMNVIGVIVNICLNIILIQSYGVIGAAYGTILAYLFVFLFTALVMKPIRPSFFMVVRAVVNISTLKFLRKGYFDT